MTPLMQLGAVLLGALAPMSSVPAAPEAVPLTEPYASVNMGVLANGHAIRVAARLRVIPQTLGVREARFHLHPALKVSRVAVNERAAYFRREGDLLAVTLPPRAAAGVKLTVAIDYAGRPALSEGRRRLQDVGPEGLVLAADGGWLPTLDPTAPLAASVHLRLPSGWRATGPQARPSASAGQLHLEYAPMSGLVLAAGPYALVGAGDLSCYARPAGAPSAAHLSRFAQWARQHHLLDAAPRALVELPAGYKPIVGADWTGLPRPAGNPDAWLAAAVWPPAEAGEPGERWLTPALGAYAADLVREQTDGHPAYLKAMAAHQAAYQAFTRRHPEADVPLGGARTPQPVAWTPVVEHKGALVWSLLREAVGEEAFWSLLEKRRSSPSLAALTAAAGPRAAFLASWLSQPGLPQIHLEETQTRQLDDGRFLVSGVLTQPSASFRTPVELALVTEGEVERVPFECFGPRVPFTFVTATRPLRLLLDPDERLPLARGQSLWISDGLRRPQAVIVYGTEGTEAETRANQAAAQALAERVMKERHANFAVRADASLTDAERAGSLILVGRPGTHLLATRWADQLPVRFLRGAPRAEGNPLGTAGALWWQGRTYQQPRMGVVQTISNPEAPSQSVVVISGLSPAGLLDALGHLQSSATYRVFDAGKVLEEGESMRTFPDQDVVLY